MPDGASSMPAANSSVPGRVYGIPNARSNGFAARGGPSVAAAPSRTATTRRSGQYLARPGRGNILFWLKFQQGFSAVPTSTTHRPKPGSGPAAASALPIDDTRITDIPEVTPRATLVHD